MAIMLKTAQFNLTWQYGITIPFFIYVSYWISLKRAKTQPKKYIKETSNHTYLFIESSNRKISNN